MSLQIFKMLDLINSRLGNIENNISRIDEKIDYSIQLQRNHLVRVKNGQDIDDSMILMGRPYNDLPPKRSFEIYSNPDIDFMILDVSRATSKVNRLTGAIHIPLEELDKNASKVQSRTTPILVISEQGLRSIQACELLIRKGYFNVNNVSGGYKFWMGNKASKPAQSPA